MDGTRGTGGRSGVGEEYGDGVVEFDSEEGPGERERDGERRVLDVERWDAEGAKCDMVDIEPACGVRKRVRDDEDTRSLSDSI